jgi:hypothetical protein
MNQPAIALLTAFSLACNPLYPQEAAPPPATSAETAPGQEAPSPEPMPGKLDKATFVVRLSHAESSSASQKGDSVTANVISPPEYAGWQTIGTVTNVKAAKRGSNRPSEMTLAFQKLARDTTIVDIEADIVDVANSKGVKGVDEEGNIVSKTSSKKKAAGAVAGGILGGLAGYALGGAAGAAAGAIAGAASGYYSVKMATKAASDLRFEMGSEMTLQVSTGR